MSNNKFIFCLEAVEDVTDNHLTETVKNLELLAFENGIDSIYQTCDTIEGLEDSLNALFYNDHNFRNYEIIYLVMQGEANTVCLNDYNYSFEEVAEMFEGKLKGKILHFSNTKVLDLTDEESQYFLDITGARAMSGYGIPVDMITSSNLDRAFFSLFEEESDAIRNVEELFRKHYVLCKMLDFRLYY